jgi:hypothetical protein
MKSNILMFFMSICPKNVSKSEKSKRIDEYLNSIRQTKRLTDKRGWKIIYCENTLSMSELTKLGPIWDEIENESLSILGHNSGERNKGIGELEMMINCHEEFKNLFSNSTTVTYFSGRHLLTNPYLLDVTERMTRSALLSNPDFVYLDGEYVPSEKRLMFNDMFFSMKTDLFLEFTKFSREAVLAMKGDSKFGSEQNLYNFIAHANPSYEYLEQLGILRRERRRKSLGFVDRWHLC